jgi:predicted PurR-regulated permease PerM
LARLTNLGRRWCLALVCLALLATAAGAVWSVAPELARQAGDLAGRARELWGDFSRRIDDFALGRQALEQIERQAGDAGQGGGGSGGVLGGVGQAAQQAFSIAGSAAVGLAELGIVLILGLYLAIDPELYLRGVLRLMPPARRPRAREILVEMGRTLRAWLTGQLVAMTAVGVVTGVGLWLLGVPQALILGIAAGLLDFVPNVGPMLAAIPGVLAAASVSPNHALYALFLYMAVQAAENNLIVPIVQRRAVDLPPALTVVALLVMGLLGGVLGLLLAVPLAAVLTVAVRMAYVEDVLGDREPA